MAQDLSTMDDASHAHVPYGQPLASIYPSFALPHPPHPTPLLSTAPSSLRGEGLQY